MAKVGVRRRSVRAQARARRPARSPDNQCPCEDDHALKKRNGVAAITLDRPADIAELACYNGLGAMRTIGINGYNMGIKCPSLENACLLADSINVKCNIARLGRAALINETTEELLEHLRRAVLNDSGWKEKAKALLTGEYPV